MSYHYRKQWARHVRREMRQQGGQSSGSDGFAAFMIVVGILSAIAFVGILASSFRPAYTPSYAPESNIQLPIVAAPIVAPPTASVWQPADAGGADLPGGQQSAPVAVSPAPPAFVMRTKAGGGPAPNLEPFRPR